MFSRTRIVCTGLIVAVALPLGLAFAQDQQATKTPITAQVRPTKTIAGMAQNPNPPSSAERMPGANVGGGKLLVATANSSGDTDLLWAERIDING
ncbi:MAG: hypothetical protein ACREJC_00655, partial [Tepidisphaeraceae bacterium]